MARSELAYSASLSQSMIRTVELAKVERSFHLGICQECGSKELVTDRDSGEIVCSKCGLVISDLILD